MHIYPYISNKNQEKSYYQHYTFPNIYLRIKYHTDYNVLSRETMFPLGEMSQSLVILKLGAPTSKRADTIKHNHIVPVHVKASHSFLDITSSGSVINHHQCALVWSHAGLVSSTVFAIG